MEQHGLIPPTLIGGGINQITGIIMNIICIYGNVHGGMETKSGNIHVYSEIQLHRLHKKMHPQANQQLHQRSRQQQLH